jgi:hypothetical protein
MKLLGKFSFLVFLLFLFHCFYLFFFHRIRNASSSSSSSSSSSGLFGECSVVFEEKICLEVFEQAEIFLAKMKKVLQVLCTA